MCLDPREIGLQIDPQRLGGGIEHARARHVVRAVRSLRVHHGEAGHQQCGTELVTVVLGELRDDRTRASHRFRDAATTFLG
jgi:hypothetical protein